jgi:midasin (ATPase involved in ribosome maturation)
VSDLFGADLPVEGGDGGQFAWRDGPFLQALKAGHWILLDEVNVCLQIHCFDLHILMIFFISTELGKNM